MSAYDKVHDLVIRALVKAGWTIVQQQVFRTDGQKNLWIDLKAIQHTQQFLIFIEIKGFEARSQMEALYNAVGQYLVYRSMLRYLNEETPLYLAIPKAAYEGIFSTPVGKQVVRDEAIQLFVFDPIREEIIQWLH